MNRSKEISLRRVTLEMSLKPFKSMEPEAIERVCEEAIRQWMPLVGTADSASVLLWVADGSEILTWDGDLEREMEWGKYIGFANEWTFSHITKGKDDPKTAILYTEKPVDLTYRHLRTIVATLKQTAKERFGLRLEVGATFDAGPEFAYSAFKYKDHPEINRAVLGGRPLALKADYTVVCPWSELNGDKARYAAYPDGIPDRTPFGEFLGRQCADFLPAIGFDYIWFSNGFGLSFFPWTYLGANYDGKELGRADYGELSGLVVGFWEAFKRACPGYRVEIRGTNFGTGMDLAKDCIPLRELYRRGYLNDPPPNSPWGALNFDFGLEMAGYMSRIAVLPGDSYPYRFYPNDPWFWQNPWTDLYDRQPHDIYCPLSVARINEAGEVEPPRVVELLTIDTERGELPEDTALEVSAHIRRALKEFPDQPGPLTWVYPFDELHDAAAEPEAPGDAFFHDWFVRNAINEGLPLNTVVGSEIFASLEDAAHPALADTIAVVSTTWLRGKAAERIVRRVREGGRVLLYGPVRDAGLLELLGLKLADGLDGECQLTTELEAGRIGGAPIRELKLDHRSELAGGGLRETLADKAAAAGSGVDAAAGMADEAAAGAALEAPADPHTRVRAVAAQGEERRIFAMSRSLPEWKGGTVAWIRGSLPYREAGVTHLPVRQDAAYGDCSVLVRGLLRDFGYELTQDKSCGKSPSALLFISRRDNGFFLTGCKQDTSVRLAFRFPDGVPLPIGHTAEVGHGAAAHGMDRTFRSECRVFVDQATPTLVSCREMSAMPTPNKRFLNNLTRRKLTVANLADARVTFYPPLDAIREGRVEVRQGEAELGWAKAEDGRKLVLEGVSGSIEVTW